MKKLQLIVALVVLFQHVSAQRQYASTSVLAKGHWLKLSIQASGIYKVDAKMLEKGGFGGKIASAAIKLFGNGGGMLPESVKALVYDDLIECKLDMYDGGDGVFSGDDFFLYYAPGPSRWLFDSIQKQFVFSKNPYSDKSFYFITQSTENGSRVEQAPSLGLASLLVDQFDERIHHEIDTINFLKSGKEWYGEDFDTQAGIVERHFVFPSSGITESEPIRIVSEVIGTSASNPNRLAVSINGQVLINHLTDPLPEGLSAPVARVSKVDNVGVLNTSQIDVGYAFTPGSVNAKAWLNWFELEFRKSLDMQGLNQLHFRDTKSVSFGSVISFSIKNPLLNLSIWDISHPEQPLAMNVLEANGVANFTTTADLLKEYIAFDARSAMIPHIEGIVKNQNLHGMPSSEMIIVTQASMLSQAERVAAFHRQKDGMSVLVVDSKEIYNEFSSGTPDPTAIRNFAKMQYDRGGGSLRYLMLMGSASYLRREYYEDKTNNVPSYQSWSSLDPLTSYVTDDYFGFLDDHDDINSTYPLAQLDIDIGRIPARTLEQATSVVDKIIGYHDTAAFGPWRNKLTLIADDEDLNIHLNDAEYHAALIHEDAPVLSLNKIYLDAFIQESGTGGNRYPEVNKAINHAIDLGTLIVNYSGHGGSVRLAQEAILDKTTVSAWQNEKKLPLFITATCDFAPFDDPSQISIGEDLLIGGSSGAIGLLTTTRLVFASSNRIINNNFLKYLLQQDAEGRYSTLGEALKSSKNYTISTSGDYINTRKFTLLGDPAMKLALPEYRVQTTTINGRPVENLRDTLSPLSSYMFTGEVRTPSGSLANNFNGIVYPTLYDKAAKVKTLGNDSESNVVSFDDQQHVLYTGKVKAENGRFQFAITLPSDATQPYGEGKLSYYAENGVIDAAGMDERFVLGGQAATNLHDVVGPIIECYLDNENFTNGGIVHESPVLIIKLYDSSAINISGIGIGHDITATLDKQLTTTYVLNDFFKPELDGFLKGTVHYTMPIISEGSHELIIRAWDIYNNSGQCRIDFKVVALQNTEIIKLSNYPNPMTEGTVFTAQLGGLTGLLDVDIQVLTIAGIEVNTLHKTINVDSNRSMDIVWDGKDKQGKKPLPGIYVYKLFVRNEVGNTTSKVRKLIIR